MILTRISDEFFPNLGGLGAHVTEQAKKIGDLLEAQVIMTVKHKGMKDYEKFSNNIYVFRYAYPSFIKTYTIKSLVLIPLFAFRILSVSKILNTSVIQGHGPFANICASLYGLIKGIPVVWMFHGTVEQWDKLGGKLENLVCLLGKKRILKVDHVVVLDDGTGSTEKFRRFFDEGMMSIVNHGIDTHFFSPHYHNYNLAEELRTANKFVIISTSRLDVHKNVDCSLKAFARFIKKYHIKDSVMILVGDGPMRRYLMNLAHRLEIAHNVHFVGHVPLNGVRDYLSIAHVFIQTMLVSNMTRTTHEAMAMSKPVVVFKTGGVNKLITHMKDGILVKPGDIEGLADAIALVYANKELRKCLARNARANIVNDRNWDLRVKKELEIYVKLLTPRKGK